MLADKAFADDSGDQLGFRPFADAIAGVIDSPHTATPFVMAINARWGAGKTTLAQMVRRRLEEKPAAAGFSPHITCWFDAWMHDDAPNLATSLAAEIAQVTNRHRSLLRRLINPLPSSLASAGSKRVRKGLNSLFLLLAVLAACFFVALRLGNSLSDVLKLDARVIKSLVSLPGGAYWPVVAVAAVIVFKLAGAVMPVAKTVGEFVRDPNSTASSASMSEVRRQLGKLIRQATPKGSKFVIFIDDLDRCRPPRSVDLLEVVNQLLDHRDVVVMLMADMQAVAKSTEIKYRDIVSPNSRGTSGRLTTGESSFGWDYLQKVVQLQFDLPAYSVTTIQGMIETLAKQVPEEERRSRLGLLLRSVFVRTRHLPRTVLRWASSAWGVTLIGALVAWGVYRVISKGMTFPALPKSQFHWIVGMSFLIGVASGLFTPVVGRVLGWFGNLFWTLIKRREIDRQIKEKIATGEREFSKVEAAVRRVALSGRKNDRLEGLVRERLQRYLEDESELQVEAEDEVMRHLEPLPRHAKRLLNRLRLLLFIAHERKMFGGVPKLTSRHIGKWAVLCERWLELALAVCENPGLMGELENPSTHDLALKGIGEAYSADRGLSVFCLSSQEIKLAEVIDRIVQSAPADSTGY